MFGFGKKKDAAQAEAPESESGTPSAKRLPVVLAGVVIAAAVGYLAYEYLPGLLDETPPPAPMASRPAGAAKAPAPKPAATVAPKPAPMAAVAPKPEPQPAPMAAVAPKPEPKPAPMAAPAPKPEPKPAPMAAPAPKPEPKPAPMAEPAPKPEPKLALAAPAMTVVAAPSAAALKYNDIMTAVLYYDREAVTKLLDLGRWVDKPDSNGFTPLMAAVHNRDYGMVRLLLERGADVRLQAPGGAVALDMARKAGDGAIESLLLESGAR